VALERLRRATGQEWLLWRQDDTITDGASQRGHGCTNAP